MAGKYTQDKLISLAEENHPGMFDYSLVEYIDSYHKVLVRCKRHDCVFSIGPSKLLLASFNGCPKCNERSEENDCNDVYDRKQEAAGPCVFYRLNVVHLPSKISFIKVGVASNAVFDDYIDDRYKDFRLEVLDEVQTDSLEAYILEREYRENNKHKLFFLPKDVWFGDKTGLYEPDGYCQLLHDQVKFVRDSILEKQGGRCPLCHREVFMPTLDHYHSRKQHGSGLVRGVICNTCNRITGVVENNLVRNNIDYSDAPDFLRRLADYLLDSRTRYIHPSEKPKSPKLMKSSYNKLIKAVGNKQKVPKYTGKFTKQIDRLFHKYGVEPTFHDG